MNFSQKQMIFMVLFLWESSTLYALKFKEQRKEKDSVVYEHYLKLLALLPEKPSDSITQLHDHGINLSVKDHDGKTLLMVAAEKQNSNCLQFLLKAGADVHARDNRGATALMYAVCVSGEVYSEESIEALIHAGADVHLADNTGRMALHYVGGFINVNEKARLAQQSLHYAKPTQWFTPCSVKRARMLMHYMLIKQSMHQIEKSIILLAYLRYRRAFCRDLVGLIGMQYKNSTIAWENYEALGEAIDRLKEGNLRDDLKARYVILGENAAKKQKCGELL